MSDVEKNLNKTLEDLEKIGIRVTKFSSGTPANIEVVSTGSITLDIATGINGFPRGRVVEVFGPEMGGKTTLSLVAIAQAQKAGGRAAFIDAEHAFSPVWAQKLGVKIDELYFNQPDYGEQALDTVIKLIETKAFDLIVIDSTASLTPKAEIDAEMEQQSIGLQARMMSKALRKITAIASKSRTTVIFINQLREKVGVMYGNPEVTPGGKALKYYSSMRVRVDTVSKSSLENARGDKIAHRVHVKVVKNKCAAPFREAEFLLNFETGIDNDSEIFDAALSKDILKLEGRTYTYETWTAVGQDKTRELIQTTPELKASLIEKLRTSPAGAPVTIDNEEDESPDEGEGMKIDMPKKKGKKKLETEES